MAGLEAGDAETAGRGPAGAGRVAVGASRSRMRNDGRDGASVLQTKQKQKHVYIKISESITACKSGAASAQIYIFNSDNFVRENNENFRYHQDYERGKLEDESIGSMKHVDRSRRDD